MSIHPPPLGGSPAPTDGARSASDPAPARPIAAPRPPLIPVPALADATLMPPDSFFQALENVPARALTRVEAETIIQEMDREGLLRASGPTNIRGIPELPWGYRVSSFRVPLARSQGRLESFRFVSADAMDPRLAIMLWRVARRLANTAIVANGTSYYATGLGHVGVHRPSARAWADSHNQGRAIDLTQIHFPPDAPTGSQRSDRTGTRSVVRVDYHWGAMPLDLTNESTRREHRQLQGHDPNHAFIYGFSAIHSYLQAIKHGRRKPQAEVLLRLPRDREIVVDAHVYRSYTQRARPRPPPPPGPGQHPVAVPPAPTIPEDAYNPSDDPSQWNAAQRARAADLGVRLEFGRKALWVLLDALYAEASLRSGGQPRREQAHHELGPPHRASGRAGPHTGPHAHADTHQPRQARAHEPHQPGQEHARREPHRPHSEQPHDDNREPRAHRVRYETRRPGLDVAYATSYPDIPADDPRRWGQIVHPDDPGGRADHNEHIHVEVGAGGWIVPSPSPQNTDVQSGFQGVTGRQVSGISAAAPTALPTLAAASRAGAVDHIQGQYAAARRAMSEANERWGRAQARRRLSADDELETFEQTREWEGLNLRLEVASGLLVEREGQPAARPGQPDAWIRLRMDRIADADASDHHFLRGRVLTRLNAIRVPRVDDYLSLGSADGSRALREATQAVIDRAVTEVEASLNRPPAAPGAATHGRPPPHGGSHS